MADNSTINITQEDISKASTTLAVVRVALGLDQMNAPKPFSPELVEETLGALEARANAEGPNLMAALARDAAAKSVVIPMRTPQISLTAQQMATVVEQLPQAVGILEAASRPAAPAAQAAQPQAVAQAPQANSAVQQVETMLKSFGVNVGTVDGRRDAQFDAAVGGLKDLVRAVAPGVQISAGAGLTAADITALEKGLNEFAKSDEFKNIKHILETGTPPAGLNIAVSRLFESRLADAQEKYATAGGSLESHRLDAALSMLALSARGIPMVQDPNPAHEKFLEGFNKIPDEVKANLPGMIRALGQEQNRSALISGLTAAYVAPPASVPGSVVGAQPAVMARQQQEQQPAPVVAEPASSIPAQEQEAAQGAAPQPSEQERAAMLASSQATKDQAAIAIVEEALHKNMQPLIDQFGGILGKFGVNAGDFLPVLETADLQDNVFGRKSQELTALVVMGLKDYLGIAPPDGVYNEAVGQRLMVAILSKQDDPLMAKMREGMGITKVYSATEAAALLQDKEKLEAEAFMMKEFFDNLNHLQKRNLLLNEAEAKSKTKMNVMLDTTHKFLSGTSWGQGFITFMKDFFENSQIGQMAAGLLSAFGINVGRLWGETNDVGAFEKARPMLEQKYQDYAGKAAEVLKAELGADPAMDVTLKKTTELIMSDLENSTSLNAAMKIFLASADRDQIREAVQKSLDEASKQVSPEAASKKFVDVLSEVGKQFQADQKIDVDQAIALLNQAGTEAQAFVQTPEYQQFEAQLQQQQQTQSPAGASVTLAQVVVEPAAGAAGQEPAEISGNSVNVEDASGAFANALLTRVAGDLPADAQGNKIEAGDKDIHFTYTPDPKDYVQKLMPSNGRVQDMLEVINDNHEALAMSLDMGMTKNSKGEVVDLATKPVCAVLEELLIRSQIAEQITQGKGLDLTNLDRKIDEIPDITIVANYMAARGVSDADIEKFQKAAESLRADATFEKAFINVSQLDLMQVSKIAKDAQVEAGIDPNAGKNKGGVNVDPKDAHLYDLYRQNNVGKPNENCLPLVFLGREENGKIITKEQDEKNGVEVKLDKNGNPEGYQVYVGIVEKATNTFKVIEAKDFIENGMKTGGKGDPAYDGLRDNYKWSSGEQAVIDRYIQDKLCLKSPVNENDLNARRDAGEEAKKNIVITAESREIKETPRPLPTDYKHLFNEPFRVSENDVRSLDGGKINFVGRVEAAYRIPNANPNFVVMELENADDQKRLGGDILVARRLTVDQYEKYGGRNLENLTVKGNMVTVYSVLDSKKDAVVLPSEMRRKLDDDAKAEDFMKGREKPQDVALRITGKPVDITLDELLDVNSYEGRLVEGANPVSHSFGTFIFIDEKGGVNRGMEYIYGLGFSPAGRVYADSHLERMDAIYKAENQLRLDLRSASIAPQPTSQNMNAFGNAAGGIVFGEDAKPDVEVAAIENFADMGIPQNDDVFGAGGGYVPVQPKNASYGAVA